MIVAILGSAKIKQTFFFKKKFLNGVLPAFILLGQCLPEMLRVVMSQVSQEADDGKKVSRKTLNQ